MNLDSDRGLVLILLFLSAAFDINDYLVLKLMIQRLEKLYRHQSCSSWMVSIIFGGPFSGILHRTHFWECISLLFGVPQASILWASWIFNLHLSCWKNIRKHNLQYHMHADDAHMYAAFDLKEGFLFDPIEQLKCCVCEITQWMPHNGLKLNEFLKTPHYRQDIHVEKISLSETSIKVLQIWGTLAQIFMQPYLCLTTYLSFSSVKNWQNKKMYTWGFL